VKSRDWDRPDSLAPFMGRINEIRRAHPALQQLRDIRFHHVDNDQVIAYTKGHRSTGDLVLVIATLDPVHTQEATVHLDLHAVGLPEWEPYSAHDELTGETYTWQGGANYVRLEPALDRVGHVLDLGA
jgi:starch synthase (maltosyl-transferring)